MSRKAARNQAMERVFQTLLAPDTDPLIAEDLTEEDQKYTDFVVNGVRSHIDELTELIAANAKGYQVSRIYKVDMAILLVAAYEIRFGEELKEIGVTDLNKAIVCNEAVMLAKKYSTLKSPAFINGVLSAID